MLTHHQIMHFRAFGYVVLRGLISRAEADTLRSEVTAELSDAFGVLGTEPGPHDGISGDYLPLAVNRAPLSQSLIADDPRTFLASAELLGSPTVPSIGTATCFTGDSSWHTRQGPDVGGVAFWADLEQRTGETGAIRVIPGSHLPEFERLLWQYGAIEPAASGFEEWDWPHVVLETQPGDVVALHLHLRMCTRGGAPRLSWTIEYLPWPGVADQNRIAAVRDLLLDDVEYEGEPYDRERWPAWREWADGAAGISSREVAVDRLRILGVLP